MLRKSPASSGGYGLLDLREYRFFEMPIRMTDYIPAEHAVFRTKIAFHTYESSDSVSSSVYPVGQRLHFHPSQCINRLDPANTVG